MELSERHPERDYCELINRALANLTAAVHIHLNAELDAVGTLFFATLGEAKGEHKQKD